MACLFENRKYIENAVRHAKSTLNVSGAQGFASDDEVVAEDGFSNNSAENDTKIFVVGSYIGIFKEDLITVTATERIALTTVMSLLLVISLCGNICSLCANMRRQLRPFFRACLISLAISDLINSTFLTTAYLSQILQEYSQVWLLGRGMCRVVPSITTAAILVSSITLVGIAMDRYFAVMRAVISFWNPGVIFCVLSMLTLWAAAIGTSWPVSRVYELYPVHILTRHWIPIYNTNNTTTASAGSATVTTATTAAESRTTMPTLYANSAETVTKSPWEQQTANNNQSYTMLLTSELVMMCVSDQSSIAMYYFAIFGVIFVPTIIAFIWMNAVIAKQLWKSRRTAATVSKRHTKSWWRHLPCICSTKCKDDERNLKEYPVDSKGRPSSCLTISNGVGINTADNKIPPPSQPSVTSITFPTNVTSSAPIKTSNGNNRETRHLRMFTVIILLITAFLFLRSPTWILMLMRIGGIYAGHFPIILHYFFGILNLTNSMLNPFFYTFLTDVLKFAHFIKTTFCSGFCSFRLRNQSKQHVAKYPTASSAGLGEDSGASQLASTTTCCGSLWLKKTAALTRSLCCKPAARKSSGVTKLRIQPLDELKGDSELYGNERDEGVDCSDASCYSKELDSAQ